MVFMRPRPANYQDNRLHLPVVAGEGGIHSERQHKRTAASAPEAAIL